MKISLLLGSFSIATLALVGCASAQPASGTLTGPGQVVPVEGGGRYTDILPQELDAMLQNKDFFFVNVHIPYEGEIADTDAFIPFDEVPARLTDFPQARDAKIVVYCRSGSMSAIAARDLVTAGYTNIYNLDGGFRAWSAAGYGLIEKK